MTRPNLHNVERSLYKPDEYVAYDGRGFNWRVYKVRAREWRAVPAANHPFRDTAPRLTDTTLTALAERLAIRGAAIAAE